MRTVTRTISTCQTCKDVQRRWYFLASFDRPLKMVSWWVYLAGPEFLDRCLTDHEGVKLWRIEGVLVPPFVNGRNVQQKLNCQMHCLTHMLTHKERVELWFLIFDLDAAPKVHPHRGLQVCRMCSIRVAKQSWKRGLKHASCSSYNYQCNFSIKLTNIHSMHRKTITDQMCVFSRKLLPLSLCSYVSRINHVYIYIYYYIFIHI